MVQYTLKQKILKYLIENKSSPHSIREISSSLKADYKNTFQSIKKISPDTIYKNKIGNTSLIEIKNNPNQEILEVEAKRRDVFLQKHKKFNLIKEDIKNLNYPFMIVLIFGSTLKNSNNKYSDIDICIISDNEDKINKLEQQLNLLSMNIELHKFNVDEFTSMIKTTENNIAHEIIKKNIILHGAESYYNLIAK